MKTPSFGLGGRLLVTLAGLVVVSAASSPRSADPNERSVWSGVYTAAQAERGREAFLGSCSMCHMPTLAGRGPIPALRGELFTTRRDGGTVGELYDLIRSTMPPGRAATLPAETYADVVAYLLSENAFPAGDGELATHRETLDLIVFDEDESAGS